jgi:hypothetical protein
MSIVFNFNGRPTLKFRYSQPEQSILGSITARLESSHRGIRRECPRKGDLAEEMRLDRFFGLRFGKKTVSTQTPDQNRQRHPYHEGT